MQKCSCEDVSDNISLYFPQCYTRKSIRDWRFWLSQCLQKWLPLLHYWVCQTSATEALDDAEVDKCTTIDAYQWFCEICYSALMQAPQSRWYWDNSIYWQKLILSPTKVNKIWSFILLLFSLELQQLTRCGCLGLWIYPTHLPWHNIWS